MDSLQAKTEALQAHADEAADCSMEVDNLKIEKQALQGKLDQSLADHSKLKAEHMELHNKHNKAIAETQHMDSLQAKAEDLQAHADKAVDRLMEVDNLKIEKQALQGKLDQSLADHSKLKAEHMELQEQNKQVTAGLADIDRFKAKTEELQNENMALQHQLELMTSECKDLQAKVNVVSQPPATPPKISPQASDSNATVALQDKLDKSVLEANELRAQRNELEAKLGQVGKLLVESDSQQDNMLRWFERNVNHIGLNPPPMTSTMLVAPALASTSRPHLRGRA